MLSPHITLNELKLGIHLQLMENKKKWEVRKEKRAWSQYDDSRGHRDKDGTIISYDGLCSRKKARNTTTRIPWDNRGTKFGKLDGLHCCPGDRNVKLGN